jgi:hypothetical protein
MLVQRKLALSGLGDSNNPNSPFNTGLNVDISGAPAPTPSSTDLSTQIAIALGLANACTCVGGVCAENGNSCATVGGSAVSPAAGMKAFFDAWGMPILVGIGVLEVLLLGGRR